MSAAASLGASATAGPRRRRHHHLEPPAREETERRRARPGSGVVRPDGTIRRHPAAVEIEIAAETRVLLALVAVVVDDGHDERSRRARGGARGPRHLDARLRVALPYPVASVRLRVHEPAVVLPRGGGDVPQLHARGHGRERAREPRVEGHLDANLPALRDEELVRAEHHPRRGNPRRDVAAIDDPGAGSGSPPSGQRNASAAKTTPRHLSVMRSRRKPAAAARTRRAPRRASRRRVAASRARTLAAGSPPFSSTLRRRRLRSRTRRRRRGPGELDGDSGSLPSNAHSSAAAGGKPALDEDEIAPLDRAERARGDRERRASPRPRTERARRGRRGPGARRRGPGRRSRSRRPARARRASPRRATRSHPPRSTRRSPPERRRRGRRRSERRRAGSRTSPRSRRARRARRARRRTRRRPPGPRPRKRALGRGAKIRRRS